MATIPATEDNSILLQSVILRDRAGDVVQVAADSLGIQAIAGILYQTSPDGTKTPLGAGISGITALTTDVVASGAGSVAAIIQPHVVTYAKMQAAGALSILGNPTGGSADLQEMSAATTKTLLGLAAVATSGSASDLTSGTLAVARLPASGVTPGTFTGPYTVDAEGRVTSAANLALTTGQILYGAAGGLGQSAGLFWDASTSAAGVGTSSLLVAPTAAQSPTLTIMPRTTGASPTGFSIFAGTGTNVATAKGLLIKHVTSSVTGGHTVTLGVADPTSGGQFARLELAVGTNGVSLNPAIRYATQIANSAFDSWTGISADKITIRSAIPTTATVPSWHQWDMLATTHAGIDQAITSLPFDAISWASGTFTAVTGGNNALATGFNYFTINAPTLTAQPAVSITATHSATLSITGAPTWDNSGGGTASAANIYALWVQSGAVRIGGLAAGSVVSDANGVLSVSGAGAGTVTSVAATAGGLLVVGGTPTISPTVGIDAMAAHTFIANNTAGAAVPTAVNAAGAWNILGVQPAANFPALTGAITTVAGALATTLAANTINTGNIVNNAVTYAKFQTQADQTLLGNVSGGTTTPLGLTKAQVLTFLGVPVTAKRIPFGSGTDLTSSANLVFDSGAGVFSTLTVAGVGSLLTMQNATSAATQITLAAGGITTTGSIVPTASATDDLGSSTALYNHVWSATAHAVNWKGFVGGSPIGFTDNAGNAILQFSSGAATFLGNAWGVFGTNAAQQAGGAATATALYTATEQVMLQKAYDCLRTFGFLT